MHPVAFKIGNFPIYYYGLMMVVAYIVVISLLKYTARFENLDTDIAVDCTIYSIVGGVAGSRILYVLLNLRQYLQAPLTVFNVREGGLSWHGALIGGFLGLVVLSKVKKISLGKICDFSAVNVTLGLAIGRIGCLLNGCCYGKECNCPWAVEFVTVAGRRHPTQIYESLLLIICFIGLLYWWKRKKFDGEMTMAMFASYGVIRFLVEIFRENTADQYLWSIPLSLAQYLSILFTVIFSIIIIVKRKKIETGEESTKIEKEA